MATVDSLESLKRFPMEQRALVMGISVVMERMKSMSKRDFEDFVALMKDYHTAASDEDREAADQALWEVLEHAEGKVIQGLPPKAARPDSWTTWVSKRIRDARAKVNLTQEELAGKTGLPQSHISRIETGMHSPSRGTLEKIAKALGMPLKHFDPSAE